MRNRYYRNIGRNISRTVREAVRSGNFEEVGRAVGSGVREITDSLNDAVRGFKAGGQGPADTYPRRRPSGESYGGKSASCPPPRQPQQIVRFAFRCKMPGRVSGLVCAVVGFLTGIPLLISDLVMFGIGAAGFLSAANFITSVSVLTPLTAAFLAVGGYGIVLRRRARRFARYRDAMGGAAFCSIARLAGSVGETSERTKKDLKKMIASGACPQGHLDRGGTCFMVNDETYEEYLKAEKAYQERAAQQEKERLEKNDPKKAELEAVRKEGDEYLTQIRRANEALPGKEISDKLDRLESVTTRIFACVELHPEKLPDIRRFIRYYMPTTLKLVKSYVEFESQPVQGENITKSKEEIIRALDTVNTAFANLLDSLFADDALDISSDISTLETMLKQEGLTGSDFTKTGS